jgi:WD40 repeat protein
MRLWGKAMKIRIFCFALIFLFFSSSFVAAEDKGAPGGIIPKLPTTPDDPELFNNFVYPMWGPVCQRYTYSVSYRDKEGRAPEYVKIYFNGSLIDMSPAFDESSVSEGDYKKGVRYEYKFVPNEVGSNFYYFEASNGLGKARASIIDSPDNGPVLFEGDFLDNEIALVDNQSGHKIFSYPTGEEWVGGVALSDDGKYLAAKTFYRVILFDTSRAGEPLWIYNQGENSAMIGGDLKGGVDISGDGSKIVAAIGNSVILFDKSSNKPVWRYEIESNAYNVAISEDGNYLAAATGGDESNPNSNLLILWSEKSKKPLWTYHSSGNFHDVSLSSDGSIVAGSTGCPDRKVYVFGRDSNEPVLRSEQLTHDSPVHRAKISADGGFIAVGSESDAGAVFLFSKDSAAPIWKFPVPGGSSVRALNFTPDGRHAAAATFGGQVYIFERESDRPVATWKFNASLGGVDIADDGSFAVAGGTDDKIHILSRDKKTKLEVPFEEYVEEIDISADGRYTAVGTGGSVYFFESILGLKGETSTCTNIIEPKPLETGRDGAAGGRSAAGWFGRFINRIVSFLNGFLRGGAEPRVKPDEQISGNGQGVCGNSLCEPSFGETRENCPGDCSGEE